jgi:fructose-1,6-bisphosphatase
LHWTSENEESIKVLDAGFTIAAMLIHFDPIKSSIVEIDVSNFALVAIFSQKDEEGWLHLIAFNSQKF